ncbi:NADP-dependent oxidoreductase domain-containing protein [Xylariaceae sp. FL1019]|nr:NADP-dependent oxidoreductase domain-containing protein [Xylariaceae sp. FL1019]
MAGPDDQMAKTAHVNMMTDTIINNMSPDGLRIVMRSLLASHPEITGTFETETRNYIRQTVLPNRENQSPRPYLAKLRTEQQTLRCMLGCGLCYSALPLAADLATQTFQLGRKSIGLNEADICSLLASIDGDIVQAITAVQKTLSVSTGARQLRNEETIPLRMLYDSLESCHNSARKSVVEFPYSRALSATANLLGLPPLDDTDFYPKLNDIDAPVGISETFELKGRTLPRLFSGLWQLSSPAWGSASTSKIFTQFVKYVNRGYTSFDMADHYGDAEIIFVSLSRQSVEAAYLPQVKGQFLSRYPYKDSTFTATKYCVFHPMTVTREAIKENISERCQRLGSKKVDLLQFHWQFYDDRQYLDALRFLAEDERIFALGLCNFDTEHLEAVIDSGVPVHTNQIQFSLIDSRPTVRMGEVCKEHNIKLLTYGTLCGGFLAIKWLGKPEPDLYDESITPSQRKYHGVIRSWGDWALFQELLETLKLIGDKYSVSVSNVAMRWVLDYPYVGAVIVGARMGISEHTDENLVSLGWSLDREDQQSIDVVLNKSRRLEMFATMGDCGGEYR